MLRVLFLVLFVALGYTCSIRTSIKSVALKWGASAFAALSLTGAMPIQQSIADDWTRLADVGVKEFLVKDGRQFLRLAQPIVTNKQIDLTAKSRYESKPHQYNRSVL